MVIYGQVSGLRGSGSGIRNTDFEVQSYYSCLKTNVKEELVIGVSQHAVTAGWYREDPVPAVECIFHNSGSSMDRRFEFIYYITKSPAIIPGGQNGVWILLLRTRLFSHFQIQGPSFALLGETIIKHTGSMRCDWPHFTQVQYI